ncbi:MAG: D-hexose-6-phosphate mutarotase [Luteolibacter sp.]|uniref:D-hexose-6-phosphate mutarotase n=1 Tax=Luteolibacter sp. TaxID=1962973 RepID=UPI003262EB46
MSDLKKFEIPGHVTLADGNGGLSKLLIETEWSTAEIYLHGAHVTHFQKKGEAPLLFLSEASEFHAEKPIRGGIPIIFPWFGPREGLPSHGFARNVEWDIKETTQLADGAVRICLRMPAVEFHDVEYIVTVGDTLALELLVGNTGEKEASFETCLHTYFQIGSIDDVSITGLKDTGYFDKVKETGALETASAIRIEGEVDRVYFDTTAAVEIIDTKIGRKIRIEKSGSASTVVWNPWIAKSKAMADFGDDEYLQMLCVESGNVTKNKIILPPGECAVLKVEVSSVELA